MTTIRAASKTLFATLALSLACLFAFTSSNASAADSNRGGSRGNDGRGNDRGRDNDCGRDNDRGRGGNWGGGHGHSGHGHHGGHGGLSFSLGNIGIGYGSGYHHSRVWVEGHYDTVAQRVVVVPERNERRWTGSYWTEVCIPAVYDTRYVKVWRAGYYR